MNKAHQYCKKKTAESKSSFYYSFLFLPPLKQKAMRAIYAFCREVDDIVDESKDPHVAEIKLKWWIDEVNRIYKGNPIHPVGCAIKDLLPIFNFKKHIFLEIIEGMFMDLSHKGYETFSDLKLYCYKVASTVGLLSLNIFGYTNKKTVLYAKYLGVAFQLVNIIRDVGEDAKRGRIYIPKDELKRFKVSEKDLLENKNKFKNDNLANENFKKLMDYQAARAQNFYKKALSLLSIEDRPNQKCALIMSEIYFELLNKIIKSNYNVLNKRISLNPIKKICLAYKSARKESKHIKKHKEHKEHSD